MLLNSLLYISDGVLLGNNHQEIPNLDLNNAPALCGQQTREQSCHVFLVRRAINDSSTGQSWAPVESCMVVEGGVLFPALFFVFNPVLQFEQMLTSGCL